MEDGQVIMNQDSNPDSSEASKKHSPFEFLDWLPWETITIWALFLGAVYVLRSFFFIVFMTFIVAYSMRGAVVRLARLVLPNRENVWLERALSLVCFAALLAGIGGVGRYFGPLLIDQGRLLASKIETLVENPQEKFDDVLQQTVGRVLTDKPGDEAYDEDFAEYQRQGLHYKQYAEFGRFLSRTEDEFRAAELTRRIESRDRIVADASQLNANLVDYIIAQHGSAVGEAGKDAYDTDVLESRRRKTVGADALKLFNELSKDDQDLWIKSAYIPDQLLKVAKTRNVYTDKWKVWWSYEAKEKIARLKELDRIEFDKLFSDFYKKRIAEDEGLFRYDYDKYVELREAHEEEDRDKSVQLFSQLIGGLLPEDETEDERLERERAGFELKRREEAVADWKKTERAQMLGDKTEKFAGVGLDFLASKVAAVGKRMIALPFELALSFLLSLFIVIDIHRLKKGIRRLEESRLKNFYAEIAPSLSSFGRLIGRAFQAQAVIAMFNTLLTFFAISYLQIENPAVLCAIVFVCSFIPVLGVVLSSVPIAVMALVQDGGTLLLAVSAVGAILVIHFIETSILNPKILGDMLHLHPVLVLAILAIGEHFFGIWGLLLGVPVIVYIIRFVIFDEGIPGLLDPIGKKRRTVATAVGPAAGLEAKARVVPTATVDVGSDDATESVTQVVPTVSESAED
jgi:predicted PurR-regulated permease PerM